jgi:hypothetical protein
VRLLDRGGTELGALRRPAALSGRRARGPVVTRSRTTQPASALERDHVGGYLPTGRIVLARWRRPRPAARAILKGNSPDCLGVERPKGAAIERAILRAFLRHPLCRRPVAASYRDHGLGFVRLATVRKEFSILHPERVRRRAGLDRPPLPRSPPRGSQPLF